jgi:hypothetical protein
MNSSHEHIYYLDPWFIAREYEMRTNSSLPAKIQKTSSGGFDGSIGVLKGRTGSQESLEFQQTPEKTFWAISPQLAEFPEVEVARNILSSQACSGHPGFLLRSENQKANINLGNPHL